MGEAFLVRKGGGVDASDSTATAADIISGKKAYISDSDEPTVGTMPLNQNAISGTNHIQCDDNPVVGAWSNDGKERLYIRPNPVTTSRQAYGPDIFFTKETSALAPYLGVTEDKIVKGNVICGVTGTANTDGGITNFPVTVSLSQPSPQAVGHVWVSTNRISSPTRIYVREAIGADMVNGSLIFISDSMDRAMYNVIGKSSGFITDVYYESGDIHDWRAGGIDGSYYYYLQYPRVYTKINGVIYIENAYIWNGSIWVLVSNADRYFIGLCANSPYQKLVGANWIGGSLSPKDLGLGTAGGMGHAISCSKNGKFFSQFFMNLRALDIYKRDGDTFTTFQTLSAATFASYFSGSTPTIGTAIFSSDGTYMAVLMGDYNISNTVSNKAKLFKFKLNSAGTAFDLFSYTEMSSVGSPFNNCIAGSDDLTVISIGMQNNTNYYQYYSLIGTFTDAQTLTTRFGATYFYKSVVSGNGLYGALVSADNLGYALYFDIPNRKSYTGDSGFYPAAYYTSTFMTVTNDGEYLGLRTVSTANAVRLYHAKISISGTAVSTLHLQDKTFYASSIGTAGFTYAYPAAISYSGDQNNCYIAIACGTASSSYGTRIKLFKGVFSGGALSDLAYLSETDLPYNTNYNGGLLIGGQ